MQRAAQHRACEEPSPELRVGIRTIARLADPICLTGVWWRYGSLVPEDASLESQCLSLKAGDDVVSSDEHRAPGPCRIVCFIAAAGDKKSPARFALVKRGAELRVSGLMMKGYTSFLTHATQHRVAVPTQQRSRSWST